MKENDLNQFSNAELKIKSETLINEYEMKKNKLKKILDELSQINDKYLKVQSILNKRNKGVY